MIFEFHISTGINFCLHNSCFFLTSCKRPHQKEVKICTYIYVHLPTMRNVFWMYLTKNSAKFRAIGHVQLRTSKWMGGIGFKYQWLQNLVPSSLQYVSIKHWQSNIFVDSGKRKLRSSNTICNDHLIFQLDHQAAKRQISDFINLHQFTLT